MKDIVMIGSSGCAKEVVFLLEENNKIKKEWNILGFVDKEEASAELPYPVLGTDEWLRAYPGKINAVCAAGNPGVRKRLAETFRDCPHISFPTIISHHALTGDRNFFGRGCIICSGVTVTAEVRLGDFVILNIGSTVCHESVLEDYVSVNPGASISGNVKIGEQTEIGVGAKIIQGIRIGQNSILGAGAVAVRDIPDGCTAVGVPARIIKREG